MSWQHPQHGEAPRVYGVYDAEATTGVYEHYADPAAAHGWYEEQTPPTAGPAYVDAPDDLISTAPIATVGAPDADEDGAIFVDGSGRRRRHMRRAAIGIGAGCVVFLGVVIAGLFGSGPSGGPLPWGHKDDTKAPRAEHSPSSSPTARPGTPVQPEDPTATGPSSSASPGSTKSDGEPSDKTTSEPATSSAPTTTAPTTTAPSTPAPAKGNATDNPGRGHGTGSTKGPK
ncbi:hypothetical protein [Streptomyces sp. AcE210]|uniref:hypothetical protein n=1 Tax=Streptomyces sp. AcE210 TaxID=2292703 RepID=UPI000E305CB0|nr:hypothetical protein [Streptomyces sp. AcE210]RFC72589.1 hypothetical protein DXZ75_37355 [Streptomyces sp. AcE210]